MRCSRTRACTNWCALGLQNLYLNFDQLPYQTLLLYTCSIWRLERGRLPVVRAAASSCVCATALRCCVSKNTDHDYRPCRV